jgi:hypothetical protein
VITNCHNDTLPLPLLIFDCTKRPYRGTYARIRQTSEWVRSPRGRSVLKFRLKISEKFPNTGRAERRHACYPLAGVGKDFICLYAQNNFKDEM